MDRLYYEQVDLWSRPPQPYQTQLCADILNLIPEDVESVLDVGCGNGYITNALPKNAFVVGTDISREALEYVERFRILGSILQLPFDDKSFDLVQAIDVIEHIPEEGYSQALLELQRVTRKYILISVPFMENLLSGFTKCTKCGKIYHVNHHYRSFGVTELAHLFESKWLPNVFIFSGDIVSLRELYFRALRSRLGVLTELDVALCPQCGAKASAKIVDSRTNHAIYALTKYLPSDHGLSHPNRTECLVMFESSSHPIKRQDGPELLQLVSREFRNPKVIPAITKYYGRRLVMETNPAKYGSLQDSLSLVWKSGGCLYYYPNPPRLSRNDFLVPAWFSPTILQTLTPSNTLWTGDRGNELLLTAIQNMESDTLGRALRRTFHLVLKRVGLEKS